MAVSFLDSDSDLLLCFRSCLCGSGERYLSAVLYSKSNGQPRPMAMDDLRASAFVLLTAGRSWSHADVEIVSGGKNNPSDFLPWDGLVVCDHSAWKLQRDRDVSRNSWLRVLIHTFDSPANMISSESSNNLKYAYGPLRQDSGITRATLRTRQRAHPGRYTP